MTWAKLDDGILQDPKLAQTGGMGFAVHVAGIVYCSQNLTDGHVPFGIAMTLLNLDGVGFLNGMAGEDASVLAVVRDGVPGYQSLEAVGLWEWDDDRRGWWIRNYLKYNPSREQVLAEREKNRDRMQTARSAKRVRANNNGTALEVRDECDGSVSNPVPVPVPISSSSVSFSEPPEPQPVDDETTSKYRAVLAHVAGVKMPTNGVANPAAYRAKVIEELEVEWSARLRGIIRRHPQAPVNVLAGYVLGEPTPSLQQYRVSS